MSRSVTNSNDLGSTGSSRRCDAHTAAILRMSGQHVAAGLIGADSSARVPQARKPHIDQARSRALEFGRVHHLYDKHVSAAQQVSASGVLTWK